MIQREIDEMNLKNEISKEDVLRLEENVYDEVTTNSNYYFSYDSNKVSKNLKVFDFNAPGNNKRHPNVILPHEHCDI